MTHSGTSSISVAEALAIDERASAEFGIPTVLLMENAARAVAEQARKLGDRYVILCGPGNNGGDGLAVARHLGSKAAVWLLGEPDPKRSPDAALQLDILRAFGHPIPSPGDCPKPVRGERRVWIDALFGTGLSRPIEGLARRFVEAMADADGPRIAIDVPSGLDADDGSVLGVAAPVDLSVTFIAPKHGMLKPEARSLVGKIVVESLGLPDALWPGATR